MSYCSANTLLFGEVAEGSVLFHFAGDTVSCGESLPYLTTLSPCFCFFTARRYSTLGKLPILSLLHSSFWVQTKLVPLFRIETGFTTSCSLQMFRRQRLYTELSAFRHRLKLLSIVFGPWMSGLTLCGCYWISLLIHAEVLSWLYKLTAASSWYAARRLSVIGNISCSKACGRSKGFYICVKDS